MDLKLGKSPLAHTSKEVTEYRLGGQKGQSLFAFGINPGFNQVPTSVTTTESCGFKHIKGSSEEGED